MVDFAEPGDVVLAVFVFSVAIIGLVTNAFVIMTMVVEKSERTSFNMITTSRAVINVFILLCTFIPVIFPVILLGRNPLPPTVESVSFAAAITFYPINSYVTIFLCANRIVALYFPSYYSRLFHVKTTIAVLLLLVAYKLIGLRKLLIDILGQNGTCRMLYDTAELTWAPDGCTRVDSGLAVFIATNVITTSVAVGNILTFGKVIHYYLTRTVDVNESSSDKIKANIILYFQTVMQDGLLYADILFSFRLDDLYDTRAWRFIATTLVWECLHTFDGIIMLAFIWHRNRRMGILLCKKTSRSRENTQTMFQRRSTSRLSSVG